MPRRLIHTPAAALRRFRDGTSGTIAIEAVILLPILFWAYLAMFSFFDMLRQQALNQKAAYTLADMVSRETDYINDTYIDNAESLFRSMIRSDDTTAIRISVLKWDEDAGVFEVDWSESRGPSTAMDNDGSATLANRLPVVPSDERVILLETWTTYQIPFAIGMDDFGMNTFTFVRPRFAPQVCFSNAAEPVNCVEV
ncbi:TadE/TadG family type IV pilus assembly protein [Pseudooceanicola sp. LIPI14-2-Ac024]|uniref:TadE/TadG family type IV pilus assembly protein n=1 Tax=Pseudooceanicola sp. LIPI14-2-Ac024 TaxID=3344875 RepID=UPI0035CFE9D9